MKDKTRQTLSCDRKQPVHRGNHRLASLQTIALEVGELKLKVLVKRFALHEEPVDALLLVIAWQGRRARFQNVRKPEAFGLGGGVHVLVRDATHVD
jgi:hypothetical protein